MTTATGEEHDTGAPGSSSNTDHRYIWTLVVIAAIGEVFIGFYVLALPQPASLSTLATITGVALASLMAGGLIGFLFGIPRRLQEEPNPNPAPSTVQAERSRYAANTNLEQISDWLTKIIVGVTLVQLGPIVTFVGQVGDGVSKSIGTPDKAAFPIAVLILYVICGFMIGYLWARLYLQRALDAAEQVNKLKADLDKLTKQTQTDLETINLVRQQLSDEVADRPTSEKLMAAIASASRETKAYAFYQAENLRYRTWRDKKGVMERTIPVFRALIASDKENLYHRNFGQLAYALKDQRTPNWEEAAENFSKAIELRGAGDDSGWLAYEANRAICLVHLDQGLPKKSPAEPALKERIVNDLRVAWQEEWAREWLEKDSAVTAWLKLNGLTWAEIAGTDAKG